MIIKLRSIALAAVLFCLTVNGWGQTPQTIVAWTGSGATASGGTVLNSGITTISTVGGTSAVGTSASCTASINASGWDAGSGAKAWITSAINTRQ